MNYKSYVFLLSCLLAGTVPALFIAQYNRLVQKQLLAKCAQLLENLLDADIQVETGSVDLLLGHIEFKDGVVRPRNLDKCEWRFDVFSLDFPTINCLALANVPVTARLHAIHITSDLKQNNLAINKHFKNIFYNNPTFPDFSLRSLTLRCLTLDVLDGPTRYTLSARGALKLLNQINGTFLHTTLEDGTIKIGQEALVTMIAGKSVCILNSERNLAALNSTLKCTRDGRCYTVDTTWKADSKKLIIKDDKSNSSTEVLFDNDIIRGDIHFDASLLHKLLAAHQTLAQPLKSLATSGDVHVKFSSPLDCNKLESIVTLHDLNAGPLTDLHAKLYVNLTNSIIKLQGNLTTNQGTFAVQGAADTLSQRGLVNIVNKTPLTLSPASSIIEKGNLRLVVKKLSDATYTVTYSTHLLNSYYKKPFTIRGTLRLDGETIETDGTTSNAQFSIRADRTKGVLNKFVYRTPEKSLVELTNEPLTNKLIGTVTYSFVRSILPDIFSAYVLGDSGLIEVLIDQNTLPLLSGNMNLKESKLYLNGTVNLLKGVAGKFCIDTREKICKVRDLTINLAKGTIHSPSIHATWNDAYQLETLHAPFSLRSTLVNWHRDFFGMVDANILFNKKTGQGMTIDGFCLLDKGILKENIFSQAGTSSLYSPLTHSPAALDNISINVALATKNPIKTRTSFLQTDAHLDLNVQADMQASGIRKPHLSGTINLDKGKLKFTRHDLWISNASVTFAPDNLNQALIDLTATNKIKKYQVTLRAIGTVRKPTVILESTPHLAQEQILSLLFGGTENANLQADLPSLLMQNLDRMVVGNKQIQPQASGFFEHLSKSLKYIQITPHFTDQTGRGGIRAELNIDLSDQFHAHLEKNFNLLEDFTIQLEYFFSDDLNVKVTRDQRGDLGSEIEYRLKM